MLVDMPSITASVASMLSQNIAWALPILLMVGGATWAIRLVVGRAKLR